MKIRDIIEDLVFPFTYLRLSDYFVLTLFFILELSFVMTNGYILLRYAGLIGYSSP